MTGTSRLQKCDHTNRLRHGVKKVVIGVFENTGALHVDRGWQYLGFGGDAYASSCWPHPQKAVSSLGVLTKKGNSSGVQVRLSLAYMSLNSTIIDSTASDIPTSQGFYEGDVLLDTQFRSPSWTRFPDHLQLLILLHCIVDLHCYYCPLPPPPSPK